MYEKLKKRRRSFDTSLRESLTTKRIIKMLGIPGGLDGK